MTASNPFNPVGVLAPTGSWGTKLDEDGSLDALTCAYTRSPTITALLSLMSKFPEHFRCVYTRNPPTAHEHPGHL